MQRVSLLSTPSSSTIVRPSGGGQGGRLSIANATNIDTLLNAKAKRGSSQKAHKSPAEDVQDKVAFIFNNLSLMNMPQKAEALKDILKVRGEL